MIDCVYFILAKDEEQKGTELISSCAKLASKINVVHRGNEHGNFYLDDMSAYRYTVIDAKKAAYKNILVFSGLPNIPNGIQLPNDLAQRIEHHEIDVIPLGGHKWADFNGELISKNLVRIVHGYSAFSGLIFSSRTFDRIATEIPEKISEAFAKEYPAIDQYISKNFSKFNVCGIFPRITRVSYNDNEKTTPDWTVDSTVEEQERIIASAPSGKTRYVVFLEVKKYFIWQTELFLLSLINNAKVEPKDILVLYSGTGFGVGPKTCPDYGEFDVMIKKYGVHKLAVDNLGKRDWYFRLGNSKMFARQYGGINKWTSLIEASMRGMFKKYENVLLLEQDLWFQGMLPDLSGRNVVTNNWINNYDNAFKNEKFQGFNLDSILTACNVSGSKKLKWKSGSIIFNFTRDTIQNRTLLSKILNYNQLLLVMAEIAHPEGARHETDMIAPNLAFADCGIDIELIDDPRLRSENWTQDVEWKEDIVVHYGWDFATKKHLKTDFSKFKYSDKKPWDDIRKVREWLFKSKFRWERQFFEDMLRLAQ